MPYLARTHQLNQSLLYHIFDRGNERKEIIENDYILSAKAYNPNIGAEEVKYRAPKEILREIEEGEKVLSRQMDKIKKFIK